MAAEAAAPSGPVDAGAQLRRFLFEPHPVRGFYARLDLPWQALRAHRRLPAPAERLLGEALGASVLLAATLKFQGTLTLQAQGDGLVPLLVAQCTHDFQVRAMARCEGPIDAAASFAQLLGTGRLAVTIDAAERAARYQGIVALDGDSLAQCLEGYFASSEQLPTRLVLRADGAHAGGLLVQKLPRAGSEGEAAAAHSQRAWEDVQAQLAALDAAAPGANDPLWLDPTACLHRLCGGYDCRVFAPVGVSMVCRCSVARIEQLLRSLGRAEVESIVAEQGAVEVTCEFCGRPFRFDAVDAERLFAAPGQPAGPGSVN